jgi:hypothetical protein
MVIRLPPACLLLLHPRMAGLLLMPLNVIALVLLVVLTALPAHLYMTQPWILTVPAAHSMACQGDVSELVSHCYAAPQSGL